MRRDPMRWNVYRSQESSGRNRQGGRRRIMKVLVACEESQAVCKAFRELGHEAFSGRIFRNKIPNLIDHFDEFFQGILDKNRQYQSSVI